MFVFRKGGKKCAGWLVPGFCFAFVFLSLQCACFLKMPRPPAQKISFVITWTEEEEEGQQQQEVLVVVLLVTKKREKEQGEKKRNQKEKKGGVDGRACAFSHDICAC